MNSALIYYKKIPLKLLSIILLLLIPGINLSQDTTFYSNGSIMTITKHSLFNKKYQYPYKYKMEFYLNGKPKSYLKPDNFIRKGKEIYYDNNGVKISEGKIIFRFIKHGKWRFYSDSTINEISYRYGINKDSLKTSEGKRKKRYLKYGKSCMVKPCREASNQFRIEYISVSGCIVNHKIIFKSKAHNFFVNIKQTMKYGFIWKKRMFEYCNEI